MAILNLKITQTNDRNLILRHEIILKDIRELDVAISQHYASLRNPGKFFNMCIYGIAELFPDLGTRV